MSKSLMDKVRLEMEKNRRLYGHGGSVYVGIGRATRCECDANGKPVRMGSNEITRALRADDSVIRDEERGGKQLTSAKINSLFDKGHLAVFRSDHIDPNPHVVDDAEIFAQRGLINDFEDESTIRCVGAGSCARNDGLVDCNGYVLFAWVLRPTAPGVIRCKVLLRGSTATQEERDAAAGAYLPRGARMETLKAMQVTDVNVRLQRMSGQGSGWTSSVEGSVWKRTWGSLDAYHRGLPAASYVMDFGSKGAQAALLCHTLLTKKKLSEAYSRSRGGAYEQLSPEAPWASPPRVGAKRPADAPAGSAAPMSVDDEDDADYEDEVDEALMLALAGLNLDDMNDEQLQVIL